MGEGETRKGKERQGNMEENQGVNGEMGNGEQSTFDDDISSYGTQN